MSGCRCILAPGSWATWLAGPVAAAQALLVPAPEEALQSWPVSHRVNRVAEEGADLMAPVAAG
jgi:putative SOS response-associated peptidase YedK